MKQTKKEIRNNMLNQHYNALQSIASICGVNNPDGKKLSLSLWKLEKQAYKITLDLCNGDNNVTSENWQDIVKPIKTEVQRLFNNNLQGLYVNGDARGSALKINDIEFKKYYSHTDLTRDWGGNGMLSPDIN